jgi:hypothetical protein
VVGMPEGNNSKKKRNKSHGICTGQDPIDNNITQTLIQSSPTAEIEKLSRSQQFPF